MDNLKEKRKRLKDLIREIGKESNVKGTDKLSEEEIDPEIKNYRREKRLTDTPVKTRS